MKAAVLHPRTQVQLELYRAQPAHALLLSGPGGSGKYFVAQELARQLDLPTHIVEPAEDKAGISIEQVRQLYQVTRSGSALLVIIKDAHSLSSEAQNALLKLLEEPPRQTHFILTVDQEQLLLPTIRSRCQEITILPPDSRQLSTLHQAASAIDAATLDRLTHTTLRLPGKLTQLLKDELARAAHLELVEQAKQFYSADRYQRQLMLLEHNFDRAWAEQLTNILTIIVQTVIKQSAGSKPQLQRLAQQARLLELTADRISNKQGNPKIHLTKLALEL